jgi:ubiquitin
MRIFVTTVNGKTITIDVEHTDTINDVKQQIVAQEGLLNDQLSLMFAGNQLKDNLTLYDCDVQEKSTLRLVLFLRGGM